MLRSPIHTEDHRSEEHTTADPCHSRREADEKDQNHHLVEGKLALSVLRERVNNLEVVRKLVAADDFFFTAVNVLKCQPTLSGGIVASRLYREFPYC